MVRAYIYLISFKNTNDIYIGKTERQDIFKRFKEHKANICGSVWSYVKNKFNGDWSNVYIDAIDSVDMDEDLTHLLNHPLNTITDTYTNLCFKKYTSHCKTKKDLSKHKLAYTEYFHIHNYNNDDKYNLINKSITCGYNVFEIYKFYNYS
jgi:hypothetical protein